MNIVNCLKEEAGHLYIRGQQPMASLSQVPCVGIGGMPGNSHCIGFPALTLSITKDSGLSPLLWLFLLPANSQKLESLRSNSVRNSWLEPDHAWIGPREGLGCIYLPWTHIKNGRYYLQIPSTCAYMCRECTSLCHIHIHTHIQYGFTCTKLQKMSSITTDSWSVMSGTKVRHGGTGGKNFKG